MKKHTCHLDFHQRSHYVTIGQKNWVQKLLDNQEEKLLDKQKEKLLGKQIFSNQPNQFHPNPIRERSERLDNMQDGRNTSRSQEISVNSFNEELSSSDRTGRPFETEGKSNTFI